MMCGQNAVQRATTCLCTQSTELQKCDVSLCIVMLPHVLKKKKKSVCLSVFQSQASYVTRGRLNMLYKASESGAVLKRMKAIEMSSLCSVLNLFFSS